MGSPPPFLHKPSGGFDFIGIEYIRPECPQGFPARRGVRRMSAPFYAPPDWAGQNKGKCALPTGVKKAAFIRGSGRDTLIGRPLLPVTKQHRPGGEGKGDRHFFKSAHQVQVDSLLLVHE